MSPRNILELFHYSYSDARIIYILKASLELRIFNYLEEYKTPEQISKELGLDSVLVDYLLKILYKLGLLEYKDGKYKNSEEANIFLNENSDLCLIDYLLYYFTYLRKWQNLKEILKGKREEISFKLIIKRLASGCKCWEVPKVVDYLSKYKEFETAKTLLDLGGGHGLYAVAFSRRFKNLKCYVFDLPEVIEEAEKLFLKGAKNVFTIKGDFFKDSLGNYDIIFSSYNPGGKNKEIAKKIYNSLNYNGLYINKQCFPEDDENLNNLLDGMEWHFFGSFKKGKYKFTFEGDLSLNEYIEYLKNLGFEILEVTDLKDIIGYSFYPTKLIVAKKVR
ncbi:hypothetical protein J422_04288 [Methanocaldococcus villosus KIN24-T80]|uniref:Methyltransferase n=1 Tax=Methanocaldococcus villosus KIN24-T80 TaxID=1069083 RepID=N6UUP4_9EURY|nr:methyltransferase [Methanocaldococcus villosus]ENN96059.1 hypothetical protein J422_04288 [Methanocaldococcus villosus KIN24-T80]